MKTLRNSRIPRIWNFAPIAVLCLGLWLGIRRIIGPYWVKGIIVLVLIAATILIYDEFRPRPKVG